MTELPVGTITFLFTDIEGSTKLWEQQPEAMQSALARHDALLRSVLVSHGGYVFKTMGDSFYAAFDTATDALDAVLATQRALLAEPWDDVPPLRVRMALHTGAAQERGGDYFGPPLNRVARLLAAGHGGQILVSLATAELVRDNLPKGAGLRDLGERRLKDLIRPERVFQLVAPDLPATFPGLRTLDARPNNLPAQPTPLIGRERELEEVRRRLMRPDVRLVTLTGPGGTGKTRLALQVAADLIDDFEHGVFFVPLEPIRDPDLVAPTMAQVLGVREEAGRPLVETLEAHLRDQQMLLVLDNFEQVTSAAPLLGAVLATCPQLKMLVTTREVLRVYGEREYLVPPLALPDVRRLPPIERLVQYEAVRLFIERALDVRPDFAVTNDNAPAVAEICHRLDGLPLAIELAAARIKILSPEAMLPRLESRLRLLTAGARSLPPRQQTLRNLIAWSCDLLEPEEQTLFRWLSVFLGGCTLAAAAAVAAAARPKVKDQTPRSADVAPGTLSIELDMLDRLASLVDKSLLRRQEMADGEPRFVMLETIREYAQECLAGSTEADAIRERHAGYYLEQAEEAAPQIFGAEQAVWLGRMEVEHDNLREALRTWHERGEEERALRLAGALAGFWRVRGYLWEARERLDRVLSAVGRAARTEACAHALNGAGTIAGEQGDYAAARALFERSLAIWRGLGNEQRVAGLLLNIGLLAMRQEDYAAARSLFDECLAIWRELGNRAGVAHALNNLGVLALRQGDQAAARALLEESLAIKRDLGDKTGIAHALIDLGNIALDQADHAAASAFYRDSLLIRQEVGERRGIALSLESFAYLAAAQAHRGKALRLAAAAAALREAIGSPQTSAEQERLARWLDVARGNLSEKAQAVASEEGRAMSPEAAVEYALATVARASRAVLPGVTTGTTPSRKRKRPGWQGRM